MLFDPISLNFFTEIVHLFSISSDVYNDRIEARCQASLETFGSASFFSVFKRNMPRAPVLSMKTPPDTYELKKLNASGLNICLNSSVMRRHTSVKMTKQVKPAPDSKTMPECRFQFRKRFTATPTQWKRRAGTEKPATIPHFGIAG